MDMLDFIGLGGFLISMIGIIQELLKNGFSGFNPTPMENILLGLLILELALIMKVSYKILPKKEGK